ncbi:MAG: SGNH/GDSL hydrolase family protein [Verrucomicrobiota bacterium]|jgi:lysophospholipase L1-like esterase
MNPLAPNGGGRFNSTNVRTKTKRIIAIVLIGLLVIAGMGGWLLLEIARPFGSGPAGPAVSRDLFSLAWTSRPVLLVGLGDSVTAGFGARKGYSYFDRMAKNPADEFPEMNGICLASVFPKFQFLNLSVSGSTSSEVPYRQLNSLPTNAPDVLGIVVMTTGGNDIIHNYGHTPPREEAMYGASMDEAKTWVENFRRRLDSTLEQLNNRFPGGCEIFLANIFDPTDGFGDTAHAGLPAWKDSMAILDAYNAVIRRAAGTRPNVHVVDIHAAFLGHGIHCMQFWRPHFDWRDPHYWFYMNLEDPNERGYDVIRRLFLLEIAKNRNRLN